MSDIIAEMLRVGKELAISTDEKKDPAPLHRLIKGRAIIVFITLTYSLIFALLLIASISSFSRLSIQSDWLIFSFASLLVFYTIALLLISYSHVLRRLKFGWTGIEAEGYLNQLENQVQEVIPRQQTNVPETPERKRDIQYLTRDRKTAIGAFLAVTLEIETKVRKIAEFKGLQDAYSAPLRRLVLEMNFDKLVQEMLLFFIQFSSKIKNGEVTLKTQSAKRAIILAKEVLEILEREETDLKTK